MRPLPARGSGGGFEARTSNCLVPILGVRRDRPVLAIVSGCPKTSLGGSAYVMW